MPTNTHVDVEVSKVEKTPTPNFFIIGAPKCGTTALAHYLSEHPKVFFAKPKEPFFWDSDHTCSRPTHQLWSLDDYLHLFKNADPEQHIAIGEGTTSYLQSSIAVRSILDFCPKARFIVMLRNPIDVAYGMHGEMRRHYREDVADFEVAWSLQKERATGRSLPRNGERLYQLQYEDVATYAPQLTRLFELVPETQRKVIIFDDFVANTRECYTQTLQFLGLDDDGRLEFPRVNEARRYRFDWMGRLYHSPPEYLKSPIRRLRSRIMRLGGPVKKFVSAAVVQSRKRPPLRDEFREELRRAFEPDIEKTSELIGRDLSHWSAVPNSLKSIVVASGDNRFM